MAIEVLEHGRRGRDRYFVLAGAAAVNYSDPEFFHWLKISTTEDTEDTEDTEGKS